MKTLQNRRRRPGTTNTPLLVLVLLAVILGVSGSRLVVTQAQDKNPLAIDFQAVDLDGQPFSGLDLKGKIVLLDFWAVWCTPCIAAIPKLNRLDQDIAGEDFQIVSIASYSGTGDDVKQFLREHPAEYTMVIGDEDLVYRYGVIGYPTYFLLDPDGNIHKKLVGDLPEFEERIKKEVGVLKDKFQLH